MLVYKLKAKLELVYALKFNCHLFSKWKKRIILKPCFLVCMIKIKSLRYSLIYNMLSPKLYPRNMIEYFGTKENINTQKILRRGTLSSLDKTASSSFCFRVKTSSSCLLFIALTTLSCCSLALAKDSERLSSTSCWFKLSIVVSATCSLLITWKDTTVYTALPW